ncbi:penicillin-binding protein activator [Ningiella sp. W23]|uniref:penicillin-binding protein activator n=1 Tax=Ningiella sp. W23 TaxID=3023715 RepID=UPI003756E2F8
MNTAPMHIYPLFGAVSLMLLLSGCASQKTSSVSQKPKDPIKIEQASEQETFDFDSIVERYRREQNISSLLSQLTTLAQDFANQGDCLSANAIVKNTLNLAPEALSNPAGYTGLNDAREAENIATLHIIRSECAIAEYFGLSGKGISAQSIANTSDVKASAIALTEARLLLLRRLSTLTRNTFDSSVISEGLIQRLNFINSVEKGLAGAHREALSLALQSLGDDDTRNKDSWEWLFETFSRLSAPERREIINNAGANAQVLFSFNAMISTVENPDLSKSQRIEQLSNIVAETRIQDDYVPISIQEFLDQNMLTQEKIAVLLPLSGRLENQGEAIKQGILASYFTQLDRSTKASQRRGRFNNQQAPNISFIDTGSFQDLPAQITAEALSEYSHIIGPLLKSHVEQIQSLTSKSVARISREQMIGNPLSNLAPDVTSPSYPAILYLNEVSEPESGVEGIYFALSPEQEAQQLVEKMLRANIRHPVLIQDSSSVTQRMTDAFVKAWEVAQNGRAESAPSIVEYTDNKAMRVGITSALNVLQSQQRINQLSNLVNEEVYSVTRNRRDVDAFVIFARPNEVELINPIIESSMSLFTDKQIPVYATSFSYNHKQNKNTLRDLRNLVFVDMPFVLPMGRESQLASEIDSLFNEPSSTFLRLFAFGYDAMSLSTDATRMRIFGQVESQGLSGTLKVNRNGLVLRELKVREIQAGG